MKGNYLFASQLRCCMLPASATFASSRDLLSRETAEPQKKKLSVNYMAEYRQFKSTPMKTVPAVVVK